MIYITDAYDGSRIMAKEEDVRKACEKCIELCDRADIKDGCGCLQAFVILCEMGAKFEYESAEPEHD